MATLMLDPGEMTARLSIEAPQPAPDGQGGASLSWTELGSAWARIEPHLPHGRPGRPRVDDRRVISGILHVLKTGCRPPRSPDLGSGGNG